MREHIGRIDHFAIRIGEQRFEKLRPSLCRVTLRHPSTGSNRSSFKEIRPCGQSVHHGL